MPRHHQVVLSTPWSSTRVVEVGEDLLSKDSAVSVNHLLELALEGLREQGVQADDGLLGQLVVHHGGKRHGVHEILSLESGFHSTASTTTFARVELLGGLKGGKGGFGAMLRSMGKGGGSKKTLDFGACRDLYGRRLRHVNDEVKLKKWLEKKEQESQDRDRKRGSKTSTGGYEKTESGIPGWHLSVPGWAEFRKGKSTEHLKAKRKTVLCNDWMDARSRRPPPFGAPRWWGCPRGRECGWAHGEEELRGKGLEDLKALQAELKQKEQEASLESYVTGAAYDVPEVQSAVMEGLKREQRARKKGKTGPLELHPELEGDGAQAAQQRFLPVGFGADSFSVAQGDCPWIEVLSGNLNVGPDGSLSGGVVGEFPTVAVAGAGFETGGWYYEIELRSAEGSIQVGWVNQHFEADAVEGDGVGDDVNSWAYDGSKQVAWHNEAEKPYGEKWEVGDVCGVLFELQPGGGTLSFTINGNPLGLAFENIPVLPTREDGGEDSSSAGTGDSAKEDGAEAGGTIVRGPLRYYPALSMDEGEAVRINIGTTPFKHPPPGLLEGIIKPVAAGLEGEFGKRKTSLATSSTQPTPASKATNDIVETMDVSAVPPSSSPAADNQSSAPAHTGEPLRNGKGAHGSNATPNTSSPQKPSITQQAAAPTASTPTDSKPSKQPSAPARPVEPEPLDLSAFNSAEELEALGLDRLKAALMALGVKCGGSLSERASRLLSLKGVPVDEIDPKLKVKAGVKK